MKYIFKFTVILFTLCFSYGSWAQSTCPTPPSHILPKISVDVDYDKNTKLYTYNYTFANLNGAELKMSVVGLLLDEPLHSFKEPRRWSGSSDPSWPPLRVYWSTISQEIPPGGQATGFSITSKNPPGLIKFYAEGETSAPSSVPTPDDDEPVPDCDEFYFDLPRFESILLGVTTGPVSSQQISAEIKIMHKGRFPKNPPQIKPLAQGKMKVLIVGSKDLNVKNIDLNSIEFGPGKAKPIASKFIKSKKKGLNLMLTFRISEVKVRCQLDRALFLNAKVGGKNIFSGAPIKRTPCRKEHFKNKKRVKFEH